MTGRSALDRSRALMRSIARRRAVAHYAPLLIPLAPTSHLASARPPGDSVLSARLGSGRAKVRRREDTGLRRGKPAGTPMVCGVDE